MEELKKRGMEGAFWGGIEVKDMPGVPFCAEVSVLIALCESSIGEARCTDEGGER